MNAPVQQETVYNENGSSPSAHEHLLLWGIEETADLLSSLAISCREAAARGSVTFARVHALQCRAAVIELLKLTNEAHVLEFGETRVEDGGAQRG